MIRAGTHRSQKGKKAATLWTVPVSIKITIPSVTSSHLIRNWPVACIGCGSTDKEALTHISHVFSEKERGPNEVFRASAEADLYICPSCRERAREGAEGWTKQWGASTGIWVLMLLVAPLGATMILLMITRLFPELYLIPVLVQLVLTTAIIQFSFWKILREHAVSSFPSLVEMEPFNWYVRLVPRGYFAFKSSEFYVTYLEANPGVRAGEIEGDAFDANTVSALRSKGSSNSWLCGTCPACILALGALFLVGAIV